MHHKRTNSRRATILLMVVGLLAMLFVIVTAFLSLARFERGAIRDVKAGGQTDGAITNTHTLIADLLANQLRDKDGVVLGAGSSDSFNPTEDLLHSTPIASLEPVRDAVAYLGQGSDAALMEPRTVAGNASFSDLAALRWPAVSALERGAPAYAPRMLDLVLDSDYDGLKQNSRNPEGNDVWRTMRLGINDADGDGIPDASLVLGRVASQMANAIAGRTITLPPLRYDSTLILNDRDVLWQPLFAAPSAASLTGYWQDFANLDSTAVVPWVQSAMTWQDFDRSARYIVTARIVSEGGKLSLYSPGRYDSPQVNGDGAQNPSAFNRDFVSGMLSWIRHPGDRNRVVIGPNDDNTFNALASLSSTVQALLARRGGLLANESDVGANGMPDRTTAREPAVLRELERNFPNTFVSRFLPGQTGASRKPDWWQRFSLLSGNARNPQPDELQAYSAAAKLDPLEYNRLYSNSTDALYAYDRRHLMSGVSTSDELARVTGARSATRVGMTGVQGGQLNASPMGLVPGQTKFYLGRIADSRPWPNRLRPAGVDASEPRGAFNSDGTFNPLSGARVIRELADYYFEMLYSYENWKLPDALGLQALRRQAFMLATNTVAFAAPRRFETIGGAAVARTAPVYYVDAVANLPEIIVGYQPQPFLTEALLIVKESRGASPGQGQPGPESPDQYGLAVELYNPNDPDFTAGAVDRQALSLDEYAISLGDPNSNAAADPNVSGLSDGSLGTAGAARRLDGNLLLDTRIEGRSFRVLLIGSLMTAYTSNTLDPVGPGLIADLPVTLGLDQRVRINLWRRIPNFTSPRIGAGQLGSDRWVLVDQLQVDTSAAWGNPGSLSNSNPDEPEDHYWTAGVARDVDPTNLFGDFGGTRAARWRMFAAMRPENAPFYQAEVTDRMGSLDPTILSAFGSEQSSAPAMNGPFTPLYTMNANRTTVAPNDGHTRQPVHGLRRPASFLTVGFLHFVPRYAHVQRVDALGAGTNAHYSAGRMLTERFGQGKEFENMSDVPADAAHMRMLSIYQQQSGTEAEEPRIGGYFDGQRAGAVPWGQLVYDYFTVLNTADPNNDAFGANDDAQLADAIDPLRVPGRININTAPWFLLAGVPVIGPTGAAAGGDMPDAWIDRSASPAFWSAAAGVLVGRADLHPGGAGVPVYRSLRPAGTQVAAGDPISPIDATAIENTNAFYPPQPGSSVNAGEPAWYRLGGDLAVSAAAYRDRMAYVAPAAVGLAGARPARPLDAWWDSYRRGTNGSIPALQAPVDPDLNNVASSMSPLASVSQSVPYRAKPYGDIRYKREKANSTEKDAPQYGFLSVGELLNVKGFDGETYQAGTVYDSAAVGKSRFLDGDSLNAEDDLFRAVAYMALLDTQWLTTRSNTFTVYVSVMDRDNPQSSVRSQVTIDRSNVLPRATRGGLMLDSAGQVFDDGDGRITELDREYVTVPGDAKPEVLSERRLGYYNARFDD